MIASGFDALVIFANPLLDSFPVGLIKAKMHHHALNVRQRTD